MRIWSLHPKYLDSKGLVALWREALLAKHVLEDKTKKYKNHPQLNRFKQSNHPLDCINHYLAHVYHEANKRRFAFNKNKINWNFIPDTLNVTNGQLEYEFKHLLTKLKIRDEVKYHALKNINNIIPNTIFNRIEGGIETWEKI